VVIVINSTSYSERTASQIIDTKVRLYYVHLVQVA